MDLRNSTYEERCQWITHKKNEGNVDFKLKKYETAIDFYLASLCGFDFKKDISAEQKLFVDEQLKIPVLNNLALCLM